MHLVGYIQSQNYESVSSGNVEDSANILPMPPTNDYKIGTSIKLDYKFLCSCDGLLLFRYLKKKRRRYGYCILNPSTNRSITVPKPPKKARAAVLVCDDQLENLVLNYKVVVAGLMENGSSDTIQTFSSKTGKWTISTLNATGYFNFLHWKEPFVVNGIIYWYTVSSSIAVYDTRTLIDDDDDTRKHLQLIELPGKREVTVEYNTVRSSSSPDDALWLCANIQHLKEIKMLMLPNDQYERYKKCSTTIPRSEWILMHNISYEWMCRTILPPVDDESSKDYTNPNHCMIWWTNLAGLIPWMVPHVALLKFEDRIFCCNLESKSFEEVEYYHGNGKIMSYSLHPTWSPFLCHPMLFNLIKLSTAIVISCLNL